MIEAEPGTRKPRIGLSGKLLLLTIVFVMVAEIMIYVPSVANFRLNWLNDRLAAAHTAALVLDAAPSGMVPESLANQILRSIGAHAVAMKMGNQRRLLAASNMPTSIAQDIDMRNVTWWKSIVDAFDTLLMCKPGDNIRVVGAAPMGGDFLEIILDEAPMCKAMWTFSVNILLLSLAISCITAMLVFLALHYLFVRPMWRITRNMVAFRADPENPSRVIAESGRRDEIGTAEGGARRHAAGTGLDAASAEPAGGARSGGVEDQSRSCAICLHRRSYFPISSPLRPDPKVQRFAPKLMRALERAIAFCQSTLSYGGAQEPPPERRTIQVEPLIEEVHEALGLGLDVPIRWIVAVERGLTMEADHDQLFRVLVNIARNAVQALETRGARDPARDQIRITGRREGSVVVIEVSDTGPGVQEKARTHLFQAFQGSTRAGGTGLGLAIAAELVRAHGGEIRLVPGTIGATFSITIPDRAVDLDTRRGERVRA
jgi:hypothetical protein